MNTQLVTSENDMLTKAQGVFDLLDVNETTKKDYKKSIKMFIAFMGSTTLNAQTFLYFKNSLRERKDLSISTKNKYLISARILLKELHRQSMIPTDITHNVKGFKQEKKHKKDGLTQGEIQQICDKIMTKAINFKSSRLKTIASILIFQGFRQMEVVGLDVSDIDFVSSKARIKAKGRDDFEFKHLHPETMKAIQEYLSIGNIKDGPLFFSIGNRGKNKRLSTKQIQRIIMAELKDLNIEKTVHGFRHFYVTSLCEAYSGDLPKIRELTGHKNFEMLNVYNDARLTQKHLPTYYGAFDNIRMSKKENI